MKYDLIGDIHGHSKSLCALLEKLGYREREDAYTHPDRRAIFLGDFIDRGPGQREVIAVVRPMIERESAMAVMGNHEFNAIGYATNTPDGESHLRQHSEKNKNQHRAFLDTYVSCNSAYKDVINWFKTLPLWLDLDGLRVVHACWDRDAMARLAPKLKPDNRLTEDLLIESSTPGTAAYRDMETILKGKELRLPNGASFRDKEGNERHEIRIRWWDNTVTNYRDAFMGPESARTHIPADPLGTDHEMGYGHHEPSVFLGHYWLEGNPEPLARNIACLDYSVAKPGGSLVAYRWDGEETIDVGKFVSVRRREA